MFKTVHSPLGHHKVFRGAPAPLGSSKSIDGVNFSLFSEHATDVNLYLFLPDQNDPFLIVPFDKKLNRTGWIWHVCISGLPHDVLYGYSLDGPNDIKKGLIYDSSKILSDPYARGLATSHEWGKCLEKRNSHLGKVIHTHPFDWGTDTQLKIPMQDLVIYEMHVRAFTKHHSSKVKHPGTFLGVIEKIPYLKKLGINAIELLPIFEFNECENAFTNPQTKERLWNFWGYSTINFFSATNRYATSDGYFSVIDEFKTMVKELHKHGIEVILDVVYNHTAEGNENGSTYSFRGIDNPIYYMLNADGQYLNFSGCGNTFNCNQPVVARLILDSLRYWTSEMHVDGFRFDLASILTRDPTGKPLSEPPLVHMITHDPILADVKLIAEAWDAGGLYQVGSFPGEGQWAEWNGKYRDVVRKFIKGTDGQIGAFARALSGSDDLYGASGQPANSINFITAHDGFTLRDLVSYQVKHNEANGENNKDGFDYNDSWNCGQEGETKNHKIIALRERQMRNFLVALFCSLGTPMILMGDEYGHTRHGNNNTWGQDNDLNWFLWNELEKNHHFFHFVSKIIHFRAREPLLRRLEFLRNEDVEWHGIAPLKADWGTNSKFLAYTLKDTQKQHHLYIAFNAHFETLHVTLPPPPEYKKWYRIIDTSLSYPHDFEEHPRETMPIKFTYDIHDYTAIVLQAY